MRILYGIGEVAFMVADIAVLCIIWYQFGPKLSNDEPYYGRTVPATIGLLITYAIRGLIRHDFWGEIGTLFDGWLLLAAIWLLCVAIQFVRPGKMVYTNYGSFWEQYIQSSAYLTAAFPFPVMHPKYNKELESFACILNPLAWYDYLIWKLVASPMPTPPEQPKVPAYFVRNIGFGKVTAPELIVRDYPDITGIQLAVRHEGDTIEVYETNIRGWYGFYMTEVCKAFVKADYIQIVE